MARTPEDQWEPTPEILESYRRGEWMCPTPPVCTDQWTSADWIRYIDKNGDWGPFDDGEDIMDCKECGGDGCYECRGEPEDCRFDTTAERDDFYAE